MQNGSKKNFAKKIELCPLSVRKWKNRYFPREKFHFGKFQLETDKSNFWQLCQKFSAKLFTIWHRSREKGSFYYFLNSKSSLRKSFFAVVEGSFGNSAKKVNKLPDLFVLLPNGTWFFEFCLRILLFPENVRLDRYKTVWLTLSRNLTRRPFFPFRVRK